MEGVEAAAQDPQDAPAPAQADEAAVQAAVQQFLQQHQGQFETSYWNYPHNKHNDPQRFKKTLIDAHILTQHPARDPSDIFQTRSVFEFAHVNQALEDSLAHFDRTQLALERARLALIETDVSLRSLGVWAQRVGASDYGEGQMAMFDNVLQQLMVNAIRNPHNWTQEDHNLFIRAARDMGLQLVDYEVHGQDPTTIKAHHTTVAGHVFEVLINNWPAEPLAAFQRKIQRIVLCRHLDWTFPSHSGYVAQRRAGHNLAQIATHLELPTEIVRDHEKLVAAQLLDLLLRYL